MSEWWSPATTPAAVLISPEDLESLEATLAVLEDSEAVAELMRHIVPYWTVTWCVGSKRSRPSGPGEWRPIRARVTALAAQALR
jgi:hypothetical protein